MFLYGAEGRNGKECAPYRVELGTHWLVLEIKQQMGAEGEKRREAPSVCAEPVA